MKFVFFVFLIMFSYQNLKAKEVRVLSPVTKWIDARNMCVDLGHGWDLPTINEIMEQTLNKEFFSPMLNRDLKTQSIEPYYLIWARSNEETLNQQLIDVSQAFKINFETSVQDSYQLTETRILILKRYLDQLITNRSLISRSDLDQRRLEEFLKFYNSSEAGLFFPIDEDIPLSEQPQEILSLPTELLPEEILIILSKPSSRYVKTQIDNVRYEIAAVENGIKVVCLKN